MSAPDLTPDEKARVARIGIHSGGNGLPEVQVAVENRNAAAVLRQHDAAVWEQGVMDAIGKNWLDVPARDSAHHRYGTAQHIGEAQR